MAQGSNRRSAWKRGWCVLGVVGWAACAHAPAAAPAHHVELFVGDARIGQQRFDSFDLTTDWEVRNRGLASASVRRVAWTLTLDDGATLAGEEKINRACPPGAELVGAFTATALLHAVAATSPTDAADSVGAARPTDAADRTGESTPEPQQPPLSIVRYKLHAMFDVETSSGPETFESQWRGEVLAPQAPLVTLDAQAARSSGRFEVHFALGVRNPNAFPVPVEGLNYTIFISDVAVRGGQLAEGQTIGAGSELQFDVTQFLGGESFDALARSLASAEAIPYHVENELRAAGLRITTPLRGEIRFTH